MVGWLSPANRELALGAVVGQHEIVLERPPYQLLSDDREGERPYDDVPRRQRKAVRGAKKLRSRKAAFCFAATNRRNRASNAARACRISPSARWSSPARTYASVIASPVPSPASSEAHAAASPMTATRPALQCGKWI